MREYNDQDEVLSFWDLYVPNPLDKDQLLLATHPREHIETENVSFGI